MILDERAIASALNDIDDDIPPDLAGRVRAGGRRRLLRRRACFGAVVVVTGAVAIPVTLALRSGGGSTIAPAQQQRIYPGLYAAPPAAGSQCNSGGGGKAAPSAYPDLLLLPPATVKLTYAFVRTETSDCPSPHVALIAVQPQGGGRTFGAGLLVEGPNAPTAAEAGRAGPDQTFGGETGSEKIDGQPATELTVTQDDHTDAYWTEPDGGQWHAVVRDLPQAAAVAALNQLVLNGRTGTATLAGPAKNDWSVEPSEADPSATEIGVVYAEWTDTQGHVVDLTVSQTPSRIYAHAVKYGGPFQLLTYRGAQALITSGESPTMVWQPGPDTEVAITIKGAATQSELLEAADLSLASPGDPRISSD